MGLATSPGVPMAPGTPGSGGMGLAMPPGVPIAPGTPGSSGMGPATPPRGADHPRNPRDRLNGPGYAPRGADGPGHAPRGADGPRHPRERRHGPGHAPPGCPSPQAPLGAAAWARPLGTAILIFSMADMPPGVPPPASCRPNRGHSGDATWRVEKIRCLRLQTLMAYNGLSPQDNEVLSRSCRGLLEPTVPPLLPAASATSPTPAMFCAVPSSPPSPPPPVCPEAEASREAAMREFLAGATTGS
ncbi:hypothetical protein QTO34_005529 [Cnephaeus nilssonii]|uniref:Uncharacterized protein n=1 Tax=Cnephaeus nilssonii TaxID=3371016 RepID=A0AA40HNQ0_CNENI|nr:hypothetical protein QTO34_005529 [Eptesicus nilssonii]